MADVMMPNIGRGKEIREYLEKALDLPPNLRWFDVRFTIGEPISIRCEFLPEPADADEEADPPGTVKILNGLPGSLDDR